VQAIVEMVLYSEVMENLVKVMEIVVLERFVITAPVCTPNDVVMLTHMLFKVHLVVMDSRHQIQQLQIQLIYVKQDLLHILI